MPSVATTIGELEVQSAPVTLQATTAAFTGNILHVENGATLTLIIPDGGTVTFDAPAPSTFIGGTRGTTGVLNLTGAGTLSFPTGTDPLGIGLGGVGTVNQTNGTFSAQTTIYIGGDAGIITPSQGTTPGTGTYNISGTSTLTANGLEIGTGSTVGGSGPSSGVLNITGGVVQVLNDITLGHNNIDSTGTISNTTGTITQSGGILTFDTMAIGENAGSSDTYALSGTGTFSGTNIILGDQAGSSGTFTQSGGTGTVTNFIIGEAGAGTGTLSSGTLTVLGTGSITLGETATGKGTFSQSGGVVNLQGTAGINVGDTGTGSYNLSGGSLNATTGVIDVGIGGGQGTFALSGTGTLNSSVVVSTSTGAGFFNYGGGTITPTSTVTINTGGTFNQNANFTPVVGQVVFGSSGTGVYNLNSGTLTIGGDMSMTNASGISTDANSTFNFRGGSVALSSSWNDPVDGVISGSNIINTTNGSNVATLAGAMTGSGELILTGGGALDLNGDSQTDTATWSVDAVNGTINAAAAKFPTMGNVTLGSTGTFNVASAGTTTLSGTFSGPGALNVTFAASGNVLALGGTESLTGTTTLGGGGTLEVANGTLGTIGGTGQMEIGGSGATGTVSFTGPASYSGATTITPGYSLFASSFGGNVSNSGILGIYSGGSPTGTLDITNGGNLISTGTLVVRMNGASVDLVNVTGTASVTGTVQLVNPGAAGTYTIVHTPGAGDLNVYPTTQVLANAFITATVQSNTQNAGTAQNLELITTVTPISSVPGLTLTPNEANVAKSLDVALNNNSILSSSQQTAFYKLLNLIGPAGASNGQITSGLDQLAQQDLQYAPLIAFENATFMVQNINNFESNIHHNFDGFDTSGVSISLPGFNSDIGHEMQSMLASFHDTAPNGVNYYPASDTDLSAESAPASAEASPEPSSQVMSDSDQEPISPRTAAERVKLRDPSNHFTEFIGGDITLADLNQSQGSSYAPSTKVNYTSGDAVAGVGYRITSNLTAGILMDYNHTDANTDGYGSKTHLDSYSPGVFATYGEKGFFANALFTGGLNQYSIRSAMPSLGVTANGSPSGAQYVGDLDFGYEFHPAYNWTLAPTLGVTYTHLDVGSYTETGAYPADLTINAQHDDSVRTRLGGYLTFLTHPANITLEPMFTAMWQHEYIDQGRQLTGQFSDLPLGGYSINTVSTGRDSALIGGGLTATLDNSMALFINATADVGANYTAENVVGGFKGTF